MQDDPEKLRQTITTKYEHAQSGDYFALLGVSETASTDDVRKAYFALAKELHPDRVNRMGLTDLKTESTKLFQMVTKAHGVLSDPVKRKEFMAGKHKPTAGVKKGAGTANSEAAKISYHKGSVMMQKRAYAEAEAHFRESTEADKTVARYWQALGWAIFNDEDARPESQRLEASKKAYEKALELNEDDAPTHYSIGLYWKAVGDGKKMRRAFEKTLKADNKHINAKRELRLLKMREGKKNKASNAEAPEGFLAKIWHTLNKKR